MRHLWTAVILSLALSGCAKIAETGAAAGLPGTATNDGGREKDLGPGAGHSLNLAHFPNVQNQIFGKWSLTQVMTDNHGGSYTVQMFFAQNEIGVASDCQADGYDVTSSVAVSATIGQQMINVPLAGRHDQKSPDGQYTCTANIRKGSMSYVVQMNTLTTTDLKSGQKKVFTRLQY